MLLLLGGILRPPGGSWDAADKYQVVIPGDINKDTSSHPQSMTSASSYNQDYDR